MAKWKYGFAAVMVLLVLAVWVFMAPCRPVAGRVTTGLSAETGDLLMAEIGEEKIYLKEIDTIAASQLDEVRMQTLERYLTKELLEKEAETRGMSPEELIEQEINSKVEKVTPQDIEVYKRQMDDTGNVLFNSGDEYEIGKYLQFIKQKEKEFVFVKELKKKYTALIHFKPAQEPDYSETLLLSHFTGNRDTRIDVYIIFDYDCPSCRAKKQALDLLITQYRSKVGFNFVYYGAEVTSKALAAEAAAQQNKFWPMYEILPDLPMDISLMELYSLARNLGLDMESFKAAVSSNELKAQIGLSLDTLALLGVKSVPTYVVNGNILETSSTVELEQKILQYLAEE